MDLFGVPFFVCVDSSTHTHNTHTPHTCTHTTHTHTHLGKSLAERYSCEHAAHDQTSNEQKDPLLIYKFESYELFKAMVNKMNSDVASFLLKCELPSQSEQMKQTPKARQAAAPRVQISKAGVENLSQQRMRADGGRVPGVGPGGAPGVPGGAPVKPAPVRVEKKVLPNEPCPCGSGKKFKKCHG